MSKTKELHDLEVTIHHETDAAVLVSLDGERDDAVWLPKSQIEIERDDFKMTTIVTVPDWLAVDKGLV